MLSAIADTHVAVWYLYGDGRLSNRARAFIDAARETGRRVGVSAISLAEIIYLQEKERISRDTLNLLLTKLRDPSVILKEVPFDASVAERMPEISRDSIPDLPDRIVAATALHFGVPVISRDRKIRASSIETIW
jgi:PIN domain nuclease of toxin-antitoxin system